MSRATPLVRRSVRTAWRAAAAVALAGCALSSSAGCGGEPPQRVVGLLGCGLEGNVFTRFRITSRGDFPDTTDSQLIVESGVADLDVDDEAIDAVTIEGLFGDTVTVVGRTARLRDSGELPVYFAPVDQWCAVSSAVSARDPGPISVGPDGNVVVVGGRDADGMLLSEIVTLEDETNVAIALDQGLPVPSVGHSVHPVGPGRFAVIGGASTGPTALGSVVFVELGASGGRVTEPVPIDLPPQSDPARAYFGAGEVHPDEILVTGGCSMITPTGECDVDAGPVLSTTYWFSITEAGTLEFGGGPSLLNTRYDHQAHVSRDGVVFVAGGRAANGSPRQQPERLLPGADTFEAYGPPLNLELAPDTEIDDSALLDGGMLVLAMSDSTIHWMTETETGTLARWCIDDSGAFDENAKCFVSPTDELTQMLPRPRHSLTSLPGERVLADEWLVPLGGLGQTGDHAINLALPNAQIPNPPPGPRAAAATVVLDDGSVLLAGGRDPETRQPALPFFVRLRPALAGADEEVPEVDDLALGSLLALQPDRVRLEDGVVRLLSAGLREEFPSVRARARGFRSSRFRFEVSLSADEADPHILLEQGAVAGISIRLEAERLKAFVRDASGTILPISCGTAPLDFSSPQVIGVEVTPETIRIRRGIEEVGQCPGAGDVLSGVGIGASGSGTVEASTLRLTRL